MTNNSAAYDFELFEDKFQQEEKFKVVRNKDYKKNRLFSIVNNIVFVFKIAIILSLIIVVLTSKAALTEINGQCTKISKDIASYESELNYYDTQYMQKINIVNAEEYAAEKGMFKTMPAQITYVSLEDENAIVVYPSKIELFFDNISIYFQNIFEYLCP